MHDLIMILHESVFFQAVTRKARLNFTIVYDATLLYLTTRNKSYAGHFATGFKWWSSDLI